MSKTFKFGDKVERRSDGKIGTVAHFYAQDNAVEVSWEGSSRTQVHNVLEIEKVRVKDYCKKCGGFDRIESDGICIACCANG